MALDSFKFLLKFITKPKTTGALCPSSRFLAKNMVSNCSSDNSIIIELGAGTGSVTKEILKRASCDRLYSIELDKNLCKILRSKFPQAKIINDSAENIKSIIANNNRQIGIIISSLPLLSIPEPIVRKILDAIENSLPKGAKFVQFTYNLNRKPSDLGFKSMHHIKASKVLLNIPPARVDVFVKE